MKKTMINKKVFIIGTILLILLLQNILALGVTPGRTTIKYPNELNNVFKFTVLNSEHKNMDLSFRTSGKLGEYIILNQNSAKINKKEASKTFTYTLNAPLEMDYGENKGQIIISELGDEDGFGAKPAVAAEIVFFVPYPGKYIESRLEVLESDTNETTVFLIPMINRGEEKIQKANASIEIYKQENKISEVKTSSASLNSKERKELTADWKAAVPVGIYSAKVILDYDEEQAIYTKGFKVGELSFEFFDIFIENFELGQIVKLEILVENKWSEKLSGVYADLILYDKNETKAVDIRSPPEDIGPFEKTRIPLYWDTQGISIGKYQGYIILNYKEFSSKKKISVEVFENNIKIEVESGGFVLGEQSDFIKILLIILIFVVILFVIIRKIILKK